MPSADAARPADVSLPWPGALRIGAPACAHNVARLRRGLGGWLGGGDLHPDTNEDLVLAVSEALENCCDHAFADAPAPGTMRVSAHVERDRVVITVDDDGRWQPLASGRTHRGRGLAMIRALVAGVELHATGTGTNLILVHPRDPAGG